VDNENVALNVHNENVVENLNQDVTYSTRSLFIVYCLHTCMLRWIL